MYVVSHTCLKKFKVHPVKVSSQSNKSPTSTPFLSSPGLKRGVIHTYTHLSHVKSRKTDSITSPKMWNSWLQKPRRMVVTITVYSKYSIGVLSITDHLCRPVSSVGTASIYPSVAPPVVLCNICWAEAFGLASFPKHNKKNKKTNRVPQRVSPFFVEERRGN
jgi:hypothetical protein